MVHIISSLRGLAHAHCALLTTAQLLAKSMRGDGYCVINHIYEQYKASVKHAELPLTPQDALNKDKACQPNLQQAG